MPDADRRFSLMGIIGGLMLSENLGDVHNEINLLCDLAGVGRLEGGFDEWTARDRQRFFEDDDGSEES